MGRRRQQKPFLRRTRQHCLSRVLQTQRRRDLFSLEGEHIWLTSPLRSSWVLPAESSSDAPPWPSSTLVTPTSSASRLPKVLLSNLLG